MLNQPSHHYRGNNNNKKKHTQKNDMIPKIIRMIQIGQRDTKNPALEQLKFVFQELTIADSLALRGDRIVVPNAF